MEVVFRKIGDKGPGQATPVGELLNAALAQWRELRSDQRLVFTWPAPRGQVRSADR